MMDIMRKHMHFAAFSVKIMSLLCLQLLHTYGSREYWLDIGGNSGYITSPNYPGKYPKNISCLWNITADSTYAVNLTLWTLDIEKTSNCSADFMQVRISSNQGWSDQARYCSDVVITVFSNSGWAQVRFVSDSENEFTGFNMTWSAVERIMQTSDMSRGLGPSSTVSEMCNGVPVFNDTITISSCITSMTSHVSRTLDASFLLESTSCICETPTSKIYYSLSSSSQHVYSKLQASVHSSFFGTGMESDLATMKTSLSKSLIGTRFLTNGLLSSSKYASFLENTPWSPDVSTSNEYTLNSRETPWTTDVLQSSSKYAASLKDRRWETTARKPSSIYHSSLNSTRWTSDALESSKYTVKSKESPWATTSLQYSGSYTSDMLGVNTETKYIYSSSLTQPSSTVRVSTGFLYTSQISNDCGTKPNVDSPPSSLVTILWVVLGVFLLVAVIFGLLLFKEIKSNRVDVRGNGPQAAWQ